MQRCFCSCALVGLIVSCSGLSSPAQDTSTSPAKVLPGTQALQMEGDITSALVDGVDRFLLDQVSKSSQTRESLWPNFVHRDPAKPHPLAAELSNIIGLRDQRVPNTRLIIERDPRSVAPYASTKQWQADLARWSVLPAVDATAFMCDRCKRQLHSALSSFPMQAKHPSN